MRTSPAPPTRPRRTRRVHGGVTLLLAALLLFSAGPMAGCVEMSRTEKSRFGNPLQSYSAGPRNTFEADSYQPPAAPGPKPWYQRLFDW